MRAAVCSSALLLFLVAGPGFGAHAQVKSRFEDPSLANPQVVLREIEFAGAIQLPLDVQEAVRADLKARDYRGKHWQEEIAQRVTDAWQQNGYFKALPRLEYEVLQPDSTPLEVVVLAEIEEGSLYRFGELRWKNLSAFSPGELRPLFNLTRGEAFNTARIREGLEALRKAYAAHGYMNFTPVPYTEIDARQQIVSLTLDMDEGPMFRVGSVEIHAQDPDLLARLRSSWRLKVGDVYDSRLIETFFTENREVLPPDLLSDGEGVLVKPDLGTSTVHIRVFVDEPPLPEPEPAAQEEDAPKPSLRRSKD
jgi:hypothetical protein